MALKKAPEPQGYELYGPTPKFPDVPYAEWKARIDKVKKLMRKEGIDLLMLWMKQNCRYFACFTSGHWELPSIQPLVALIPVDGEPVALTGEFFRWTVEAQSWIRDIRTQLDVHQADSERAFPKDVAQAVKDMGYEKATIALEKGPLGHMYIPRPLNDIETLMKALPHAKFVDGDKVIWECRMIKSPLEIERLTKAAMIYKQALSTVVEKYRPGMTENDVGKIYVCAAIENGADKTGIGHIMCGSDREGMWDTGHYFDGCTINRGDYLSLDTPVRYKGYWADMGRIINVGPATESWKNYWDAIGRGFDAAVKVARPGVKAKEVWKAVNDAVEEGGLMGFEMYGHGIGIDVQEPPVLGMTGEDILEAGMTFEVESLGGSALRKFGGPGIFQYENLVIITENGCSPVIGLPHHIIETTHC
ncbi:aminopeptidase P family protein [Candidatus Poribacteria bacterium]|nr:aminopeptidase P family protein [Candidatus Poribacteria bacterium]